MDFLLKDGIRYLHHRYKDEKELQQLVQSNIHYIFGPDAFFFPGTRIGAGRKENGAKGIPDGFVISLSEKKWYIIEVELARHSYFDHIAPQVMRFYAAWEDSKKRKDLVNRFTDAIQESPVKIETLSKHRIKEIYRFVSDMLEEKPTLAVVIDEEVKDLNQLRKVVQFDVQASIFKTFAREGMNDLVPIYQIESLEDDAIIQPRPRPNDGSKEILIYLDKKEPISTTKEILINVSNELIRRGVLTEKMLPWGPGKKRYIVSKKPIHPGGNDFFAPVQLINGWWVETHSSRESTLSYASHLLKKCGQIPNISIESI